MRTMTTRGRRLARLLLAGGVLAAVACQPEPPAPTPTIISATASAGVAGQPITFTIVATHPGITPNFLRYDGAEGPSQAKLPISGEPDACFPPEVQFGQVSEPGESTMSLTCTLPTTTLNGNWNLSLWVGSNGYAGRRTTIPFTVTGGVHDSSGPIVTAVTPNPQYVTRGQTFSVSYRIEDPHVAPNAGLRPDTFEHKGLFVPYSSFGCDLFIGDDFQVDTISPTVVEVSYTCTVPTGVELGDYTSSPQYAVDIYGFRTHIPLVVVVG